MAKYIALLCLIPLLAACSGQGGGPTVAPTAAVDLFDETRAADESPRVTTDSGLPPTFTPAPTPVPATPEPRATADVGGEIEQERYIVLAGDTLAEIAAAFGVTLDALAAANGIEDVNVIEVGQELIIPR